MALLNSVDSKLCMNRLQSAAGFNYQQAKVLYGVYGKAQTLFNLPAAFIKYYPSYANGTMTVTELARVCSISRPTAYKYIRMMV